jgi:hypothetical protein
MAPVETFKSRNHTGGRRRLSRDVGRRNVRDHQSIVDVFGFFVVVLIFVIVVFVIILFVFVFVDVILVIGGEQLMVEGRGAVQSNWVEFQVCCHGSVSLVEQPSRGHQGTLHAVLTFRNVRGRWGPTQKVLTQTRKVAKLDCVRPALKQSVRGVPASNPAKHDVMSRDGLVSRAESHPCAVSLEARPIAEMLNGERRARSSIPEAVVRPRRRR